MGWRVQELWVPVRLTKRNGLPLHPKGHPRVHGHAKQCSRNVSNGSRRPHGAARSSMDRLIQSTANLLPRRSRFGARSENAGTDGEEAHPQKRATAVSDGTVGAARINRERKGGRERK